MLITVASSRCANQGRRDVDRYAAWREAVQQLRDDWREGKCPGVAQLQSYLRRVPEGHRSEAGQDLTAEHLRLTWQVGQGALLETYFQELGPGFGTWTAPDTVPADLVEDEFLARYLLPHGDTPALAEYEQRFSLRPDIVDQLRARWLNGGRYVKLRPRGRGAMGEVWEGYDRSLERSVAVKEPGADCARDVAALERFANEARLTAGLEHPGIVGVHEYQPAGNPSPFYVMRLVSGPTLAERIRDYHQPVPDRPAGEQRLLGHELLRSFVAVCDAMAYAHARGVLHRDLKPGNVVVGEYGETVILDWGMGWRLPQAASPARPAGTTASNLVVGTPEYMPPEQTEGIADVRSDVFGLGAILYEILTGQPPHAWADNARPADWQQLAREARFPPPRGVKPEVRRALEAVCLKALARQPAERYASASDLAREIRRYLAGEPVTAWVEPATAWVWRWFRRRAG